MLLLGDPVLFPPGLTPQIVPPPPDRCCVCYGAAEYDDNQLVQCDGCAMLVHMRCYGVPAPPNGAPWCVVMLPRSTLLHSRPELAHAP